MKNATVECILEWRESYFPRGLLKIIKVFFEGHHSMP